jgi:micrococcal nuclease
MSKLVKTILGILIVFLALVFGISLGDNNESNDKIIVEMTEVVDGDTIWVRDLESGDSFRVRYLGIDTPEIDGLDYETCFAENAKEKNEELIVDKKLSLEFDIDKYDSFGRTLAYVYTEDGIFVNLELLEEGYARFYYDKQNTRYQDRLIEASLQAQNDFKGLWGACGEDIYNGQCLIKGNVDRMGVKYYHFPEDKYYDETVVNLDNEDQWLCTVEEAEFKNFKHVLEE